MNEVEEILERDYRPDDDTLAEMDDLSPCSKLKQLRVMQGLAAMRSKNQPADEEVLH